MSSGGKKKKEEIEGKIGRTEDAMKKLVDEATANSIYDEILDFASYAFNKSHARGLRARGRGNRVAEEVLSRGIHGGTDDLRYR